jgi:hypothetical protein
MSTEAKPLTTIEVGNRLVELCRLGKITEAQQELFTDDVICIDPSHDGNPTTVKGKAAAIAKTEQFSTMIEEVHGGHISEPVVAGNWFSISWTMDITIKGQGRQNMEEIVVYHVENGHIVSEQYFF